MHIGLTEGFLIMRAAQNDGQGQLSYANKLDKTTAFSISFTQSKYVDQRNMNDMSFMYEMSP